MEYSEDSINRTLVFKGKRSKRPRQFMEVAMITSTSSIGGGGGSGGGSDDIGGGGEIYSSSIRYSSPTTSTTQISSSSTEEDEDMANCLILLAQSGRCQKLHVESSTERKMVKISSRKFTKMTTTTTTGNPGFYVYECKTCNRTFPSFQALGGHRTSHKKIKAKGEEKKSTADSISQSEDHHQQKEEEKFNRVITPSVNSTQILNKGNSNSHGNFNSKPKIHECSICRAEFSSGQALGGHMRRHRPPTITATNIKITVDETSNNTSGLAHDVENSKEKPKIFLSLDLNLPASPEDDHHRDTNFEFSSNKQSLVFSAATLVNCHY